MDWLCGAPRNPFIRGRHQAWTPDPVRPGHHTQSQSVTRSCRPPESSPLTRSGVGCSTGARPR
ncbi:hypothetical protein LI90_3055 [Carbonactinospora thermoautotrophica]|uniref:Uncharacterized protein n=1 Tax=Carbonactinospora thermoautotrophica TaxID=1469144 RepID=A0A132MVX9_9ACTN|nr:hypothetical protein LI90_3055 [Carbonactinospora thermoautotrophica]